MESNDDQNAINLVLKGDTNAFGALVQRYQRPIFNLMYRVAGSTEEAAELTQETFLRTYENLERYQPGKKFFSWLYAIGLNIARDFARKNKTNVEVNTGKDLEEFSGCQTPGDQQDRLCESLDFMRLEKALGVLPILYREALVLRYREELPMQDIAEALNVSVSAAKMRVKRGLEMLRQTFKGTGYEK
jgi:RNA polymerase sigma-70 factor (ECF subfamily)